MPSNLRPLALSSTLAVLVAALLAMQPASAQAPVRSHYELVSSNGYTGVVLDLSSAKVHHFREHVFATEEPVWDSAGSEVWTGGGCSKPRAVSSRDLLYDAYFGFEKGGTGTWLPSEPVDLDRTGYDPEAGASGDGGTGIVRMVQPVGGSNLEFETRVFAPWGYQGAAFVMLLRVTNTGSEDSGLIRLYGLVNVHLGTGRPGARQEIGSESETIRRWGQGLLEQGFAGLVYVAPLGSTARVSHSPALFYTAVTDGTGDLPLPSDATFGDDLSGAVQWNVANIAAGESAWVGMVIAHDPNPDFVARTDVVDQWVAGRDAATLWQDERDQWAGFQGRVAVPDGLSAPQERLLRHSAAVLRMAQVREDRHHLREHLDPGVARHTGIDGDTHAVAAGGEVRQHQGAGAIVASLPPGEWAYAWIRDGAYAVVGLTDAALYDEARAALRFFIDAQANRYHGIPELDGVPLEEYGITLTRYHGFGIEESDTLCGGDFNFEWDGFGLFLWALRHYVEESGDTSIVTDHWDFVGPRVADVLVGLVEPETGLLAADSSIWEVHWLGKEKHFAYTNITAARGLCDAAWLAETAGHSGLAATYDEAGRRLRQAIHTRLRDSQGAIAANTEELATGGGYWDAAVLEAIAMGLFAPEGPTAAATLRGVSDSLTVSYGPGLARNDDSTDGHDLTPYGGSYDALEWVFIDFRASIAARHSGDDAYAEELLSWIQSQTELNYLLIGENYDQNTGEYRNNAPMIGFGSGSYITALRQRQGQWSVDPACGTYFEDDPEYGPEPDNPDQDAGLDASDTADDPDGSDEPDVGGDTDATDTLVDAAEDATPDVPDDHDGSPPDEDDAAEPRPDASGAMSPSDSGGSDGCGCAFARPPRWSTSALMAIVAMALLVLTRRRD